MHARQHDVCWTMQNGDNYLNDGHFMPPERPWIDGHLAIERCRTVLSGPSLVVPCLVSPFTRVPTGPEKSWILIMSLQWEPWFTIIVTSAVACLDTCVRAGGRARSIRTVGMAWRPASSQKSRVISALHRPHTAAVKTTEDHKLNDRWRLAAELLVTLCKK